MEGSGGDCAERRHDTTLVFATLHTLAALAAIGEYSGVRDILSALELKAAGNGDQARVAAEVGLPLARIIAGMSTGTDRKMLDRLVLDIRWSVAATRSAISSCSRSQRLRAPMVTRRGFPAFGRCAAGYARRTDCLVRSKRTAHSDFF